MSYHDGYASSIGSKTALLLLTLAGVLFSLPILSKNGQLVSSHSVLLLACVTVFYLRLAICLLVFVKRKVSWIEGSAVGILYGILVYMFSVWGSVADNISAMGIVGVILFVAGAWVNSQSDYQRYKWKKLPSNAGHIYTGGLFRYAMHINFFGDTVMFVGYAMVTQNSMSFIPVAAIFLNFILFQIPSLDNYLLKRYGEEFTNYAQVTPKFIPFIY